jgi:transcription antitermination factor NusG
MQKNWYILYTKTKCEKKVATLLAKRKIENFCPLNCRQIKHSRKSKFLYEPLFNSYVFACVEEREMPMLRKVEGVVSIVHWKGEPATIKAEEIEAIREFSVSHRNIKLERTKVNANGEAISVDGSSYTLDGKILMVKNRSFNVNLPSLGYTMIAEVEADGIRGVEIPFGNKELLMQS